MDPRSPPPTRGHCEGIPRPCARERCIYWEPLALGACALDQADSGPVSLERLGEILGGLSRQGAQQAVVSALDSARRILLDEGLAFGDGGLVDAEEAEEEEPAEPDRQATLWDYYSFL